MRIGPIRKALRRGHRHSDRQTGHVGVRARLTHLTQNKVRTKLGDLHGNPRIYQEAAARQGVCDQQLQLLRRSVAAFDRAQQR